MAKGKSTWKYNKLLTARRNYFDGLSGPSLMQRQEPSWYTPPTTPTVPTSPTNRMGIVLGGYTSNPTVIQPGTSTISNIISQGGRPNPTTTTKPSGSFLGLDWGNPFKGENGAAAKNALVSAAGAAVGNIGGGLIGGGLQSGAGNVLQGLSGVAAAIPGPWGAVASSGLGVLGGLTNRMFGSKMNTENIAKVEANINNLNNFQSNASDFDTLSQNWANADVGMTFNDSYIGKDGWFSNKAKNKAADLRRQIEAGNAWVNNTLVNNADNIATTQMQGLLGNYAAFGGPLLYSKGGSIHIKPENRGKFTETKRRTGKTTEELTHSSNPLTRKRAIFAQNAKKWHHAFGGELNTQGGDFTNGLLYIDNGGSHESNPYEGVQLGIDPEGAPNLVEEGETVFNDYVFSKRLKVPKAVREKYKMRSTKEMTFAEMSKEMARESEERPNDPISMRGLEALMSDLAGAQEELKETQTVRQYARGGRLFEKGGNKGNQTLNYDNSTTGLYFGLSPEQFNPYNPDNTINWDIMYGANSPYTKRRQYVIDHWDDPGVQEWLGRYVEGINEYNKGRKGYQAMTKSDVTKDIFTKRTFDKSWGGMHAGVDYAGDPEEKLVIEHMLRKDGAMTPMPDGDIYYPDTDFDTGLSWADRFKDKYTRANNGNYVERVDPETHTRTRRYIYDPVEPKKSTNRYYRKGDDGQYSLVEGDNPLLTVQNAGLHQVREGANDLGGNDYFYDPDEVDAQSKTLPTWFRFAPAAGLGIAAITDAIGLTNKPDYGNAEAVLEASRGAGTYQPVRFKPIGNYLTYKPFDRDFYINKMNAEAGATRRSLLNTSGGNRATAMAGLLAADNNYLNQIGGLARQAEEYNLAQRQQVEDFNRGTNTTNSQGFLQADIANQKALMDSREFSLKGTMAAAEMRERARLASEQAKSANLSGFVTALGDIGRENMAWNWRNFGIDTGTFGSIGSDQEQLLTHRGKKKASGGKIKRKKGLTI